MTSKAKGGTMVLAQKVWLEAEAVGGASLDWSHVNTAVIPHRHTPGRDIYECKPTATHSVSTVKATRPTWF